MLYHTQWFHLNLLQIANQIHQPKLKFWMTNEYVRRYQVLKYLKREFWFMHLPPNRHVNLKDVDINDPTRFRDFLASNYVASDGRTAVTQKQILDQIKPSTVPQGWNIPWRILLGEPETGDVTGQQNSGVSSQVQVQVHVQQRVQQQYQQQQQQYQANRPLMLQQQHKMQEHYGW